VPRMDTATAKAKEHKRWSTASPAWKRYDAELLAWLAPVTDRMIERMGLEQGQRVLGGSRGMGWSGRRERSWTLLMDDVAGLP